MLPGIKIKIKIKTNLTANKIKIVQDYLKKRFKIF